MKTNKVNFAVIKVTGRGFKIRFVRDRGRIKVRPVRQEHLERINRLIVNHPPEDIFTYLVRDGQETELYNG